MRRSAFTLIELLVVISIVALLIAILLPALAAARKTAQAIGCAANQQQIGIAMRVYASEYRDHVLPSFTVYDASFGPGNLYWFQSLMLKGWTVGSESPENNNAVCPADDQPWTPYTFNEAEKLIFNSSYGANPWPMIVDWDRNGVHDWYSYNPSEQVKIIKVDHIRQPSKLILITDTRNDFYFDPWWPNTDDPAANGEWAWERHGTFDGTTGGRVNVLHADGHVSTGGANSSYVGLADLDAAEGKRQIFPDPSKNF